MASYYSHVLSTPPVVCGFISFVSCVYVCASAIRSGYVPCKRIKEKLPKSISWDILQQKLNSRSRSSDIIVIPRLQVQPISIDPNHKHPTQMIDLLFWMCLCDGLYAIQIMCNWFPLALGLPFWNEYQCNIFGMILQFLSLASPFLHVLLAYNLGYLLLGGSIKQLCKQKKYQFIIVIVTPLICTVLPQIYKEYGAYDNNIKYNDMECWVTKERWRYMYVVAVCFSLLLHYAVIIIAITKWKYYTQCWFDRHFKFVAIKLLRFVVIYTIVCFFPVFNRIWEMLSPDPPPLVLICAHHIGISLLGFCNALVWCVNQKEIPYKKQSIKRNVTQKYLANDAYRKASYELPDSVTTDHDKVESTDYWISTRNTQHITQKSNISNPNAIVLFSPNTRSILPRDNTEFDITTEGERYPDSVVMWSLVDD